MLLSPIHAHTGMHMHMYMCMHMHKNLTTRTCTPSCDVRLTIFTEMYIHTHTQDVRRAVVRVFMPMDLHVYICIYACVRVCMSIFVVNYFELIYNTLKNVQINENKRLYYNTRPSNNPLSTYKSHYTVLRNVQPWIHVER